MKIAVVGIDPSLSNFGFAKASLDISTAEVDIEDLFLSRPDKADKSTQKVVRKNSDDLRRAKALRHSLVEQTADRKLAFVECPVGSQSSRAMASYGICIGILASCSIPMIQVTPMEVKISTVGKKTASKAEMISWAMDKHPEAPWLLRSFKGKSIPMNSNEHLADAIAAIYAGIKTDQYHQLLGLLSSHAG